MTEQSTEDTVPMDVNTVVSKEDLTELQLILDSRNSVALQLLELEEHKIQLLRAARDLSVQQQQVFGKILEDRGLPSDTKVRIDTNGSITLLEEISEG